MLNSNTQISAGDIAFCSVDHVIFHIHKANLELVSTGFPPATVHSDEIIPFDEEAETLEIFFSLVYPNCPLPHEFDRLTFTKLVKVTTPADKWGMHQALEICLGQFHKHIHLHQLEILELGGQHNHAPLVAAVAPYLVHLPLNKILSSLPYTLFKKWADYRERWIWALLSCYKDLDKHSGCSLWNSEVKPHLQVQLFGPCGYTTVLREGHDNQDQRTIGDRCAEVYIWLHAEKRHSEGLMCCETEIKNWKERTLQDLQSIPF
ncbi:hypothetical protein BDP27DRAFT_1364681 [Rhodocollybia butyracea]|uniref:BTB domain-containing protein n=1 Tax=Rhodocollybia butyracea TaxID=206335 RepID=A0A9P5PQY8_9AGAR|nr:hypothetical protein BDP27DRAFT_1364681 [Rhodocollybia butyracea]